MKNYFKICYVVFSLLFVVSCSQDEAVPKKSSPPLNQSEISLLEQEQGIEFFKRDIVFENEDSRAVLRVATANEELFHNVVEKLNIEISAIHNLDELKGGVSTKQDVVIEEGNEIMTEFIESKKGPGVLGFKTTLTPPKAERVNENGKTELSGYTYYVWHYSDNWPSQFYVGFFGWNGGGVQFEKKNKWYNGWESDTNCIIGSTISQFVGLCGKEFDLYSGADYLFNVDGPYRCRVKVGTWDGSDPWTWSYIR
jgi:hypothetical protein